MSGNINSNTFVGLTYHELSQEGFGLPSIRSLRAPSKKELFNAPIVKAAAAKAKAYGMKKGYTNLIPTSQKDKEMYVISVLAKRGVQATEKEIKSISKKIEFVKIDGVVVLNCDSLMSSGDKTLFAFALVACGIANLFAVFKIIVPATVATFIGTTFHTLNPTLGTVAGGAVLGASSLALGVIEEKVVSYLKKKLIEKNIRKDLHIFTSWVAFKSKDGKVILKRFCNAIIDPKMYVPSKEDLEVSDETDEVSMTDLVEDETTVEEDAGKDSEVKDIDISQDDSAHNEEASSGGVVTPGNKDDLEVEQTSIEAWFDDPAYSLEEADEEDCTCKDCHKEEDTENDSEDKKTSEEALGITDYDLYSEDQYKSLEGIFDPDDLV